MALSKLQQQVQQLANDIDENYIEIDFDDMNTKMDFKVINVY